MSIANRVFMLFGVLMVIMLGSQLYMMQSITNQVSSELGKVAFSVAKDTAGYFVLNNLNWTANNVRRSQSISTQREIQLLNGQTAMSTAVIEVQAPSVEIRIDNQRTDEAIQLISANHEKMCFSTYSEYKRLLN